MKTVNIKSVIPDKNQPRKYFQVEKMASLKDSIRKHGIINPLVVQPEGDNYLLIDGERRYRAAVELGLKEVPVNVVSKKGDLPRLIEQFHIQEQHAEWTSSEKAMAILDIMNISKKTLKEVGEMLSISKQQLELYAAFAQLQNKEKFIQTQCGIENAVGIRSIKYAVRDLKEKVLNEPFTKADENTLEKVLIAKISDGEITGRRSYPRIKDSLRMKPKLIDELLKGKFDIDEKYVSTNAKSAGAVRKLYSYANYITVYGHQFLKDRNVRLSDKDIGAIRNANKVLSQIIKLVD